MMLSFFKNRKNIIWLLLFLTAAAFCAAYFHLFLKVPTDVAWQQKQQEIYGHSTCVLQDKRFSLAKMSPGDGAGGSFSEVDTGNGGGGSFSEVSPGDGVSGSLSADAPQWQTPKEWMVQDFLVTDLDGDSDLELILLVWKRGRYGPAMPFWVKADEKSYSQHIFIYDVSEDLQVKEKWLASDIGPVVRRMKLMEKNPAILLTEEESGRCNLWRWESWGLKNMDNEVSLVAFGDNLIHKEILDYGLQQQGGDFAFLYEPFLRDIQAADIAALNSETPLVDKASAYGGYPSFGTPVAVGKAIAEAGFDVAACANNHCLDRGIYGIGVTGSFYRTSDILCLGIHSPFDSVLPEYPPIISRNGMTFAMLNYTYDTNSADGTEKLPGVVDYLPENEAEETALMQGLQTARDSADVLVVFVHWGEEYSPEINEQQKHFAQLFAKAGVDLVIGSHPHVLQKCEEIARPDGGTMLVYYSLGNFRANQGKEIATKTGGEAVVTFEHCFDGVRIKDHELKEINAYWK